MKNLLQLFIILVLLTCCSQSKSVLKQNGNTLQDIIPTNWSILESTTGDLNQDGILDLVFAIQNSDVKNIELNDNEHGNDSINSNTRILGIYFGDKSGNFIQKLISEEFIIIRDSPTMDEPFEGFSINKNGILDINFKFWYSAGNSDMSNHKYKFHYQNNEFVLIGYDSNEAHRSSGETTDYSIDFLSKKIKITTGNFSDENSETVEWKKFSLEKPMTLKTIKKPFELEFEGIYL